MLKSLINELTFDGTSYTFTGGWIEDYGNFNPFTEDGDDNFLTHYNYDFTIVDDEIELITEGTFTYYEAKDPTIDLYVTLFAPNASAFEAGTYEYMNLEGLTEEDVKDKFFFDILSLDINPNSEDGRFFDVISGNVIVVENSNFNYTLTYNVVVKEVDEDTEELIDGSEQTVSFSYTGDFLYSDERNDNAAGRRIATAQKRRR